MPDPEAPQSQASRSAPGGLLAAARRFIEALPYAAELGLQLQALDGGRATLWMPYDPKLIGDPATGVLHGGAVFALMDTASGAAVMCHPSGPQSTATLDLRVDYMRPATAGQAITAQAECYHVTRSVAFVRVTACDDDKANPVATGTGTFMVDYGRSASA